MDDSGLIFPETPNVEWDHVVGLDDAKTAIHETIVLPFKFPSLFAGSRLSGPSNILLYGPPGTGTTHIVRAASTLTNSTLFRVCCTTLIMNKTPQRQYRSSILKHVFKLAQESTRAIIFLDKIDALCIGSQETDVNEAWIEKQRNTIMELLVLMGNPAFYNRSSDKQMAVIGATNAPWLISRPILRRFLNRRYCPLPSVDARKRILEIGLGDKVPSDLSPVDYDTLALMTNGHTGATISRLIKQALAQASERHASSIHFKTTNVSAEDSDLVECMPCFPDNSGVSGVSGPQIRQLDAVVLPPVTLTDFLIVLNDADVGEKIPEFDTEKYEQWKV